MHLTLISHTLCPYVQRVSIILAELNLEFKRVNIDLSHKPDWFLKISPLNKVPVLVIDENQVLFESSVISQYIHEAANGTLLSSNIFSKHQQLAWTTIASDITSDIGRLYNAKTDILLTEIIEGLKQKFQSLEENLLSSSWFSHDKFTMVDAAFAPAFRYFNVLNKILKQDLFADFPALASWRLALLQRPSVINAVSPQYEDQLLAFLQRRDSIVGTKAQTNI